MLGIILGTVCLVLLFKVLRHERHGWAWAHGCGGGHHHHGSPFGGPGFGGPPWARGSRGGRGGFGRDFLLRGLFARLEATPGQEKVMRDAFAKVREAMREARAEWRDTSELSSLLRGETFDRTAAEGVSGKADASFAKLRVVVVEALAEVHEALDDRQRRILADLVEARGRGFWRGPFGHGYDAGEGPERWV